MKRLLCILLSFPGVLTLAQSSVFNNPMLAGFNPDPAICRVGEDYYVVTSTFAWFPGIPVLHSKDLVHFEQIGAAIDRPSQMSFMEQGMSRGLFAPSITYHDGWFYIVCTLIDHGGNFIVRSQHAGGPYSDPFWLPEVNGGIDPSIFVDEDGSAFLVYNHVAPDNQPLYSGHRTIRIRALDLHQLKLSGEETILVNGGTDLSKKPIWIEAPHLYKVNGKYYLMAAEGGTAYEHSEVVFRADHVLGPYASYSGNPILTQRHLNRSRQNPITSTGHADLVQLPNGDWWAVFLGCRPYREDYYNTGRETFLAPVSWRDGWPVINPDFETVQYQYPLPFSGVKEATGRRLNGNGRDTEDFTSALDVRWMALRNSHDSWTKLDTMAGTLRISLRPETIASTGSPSLLVKRQPHLFGEVWTEVDFAPDGPNEMAGLIVIQNDQHYYFLNRMRDSVQVLKTSEHGYDVLRQIDMPVGKVFMNIKAEGDQYAFYAGPDSTNMKPVATNVDATFLSTKTAGGFIGCMYGLYASSNGEASNNSATYDFFEIRTNDTTNMKIDD